MKIGSSKKDKAAIKKAMIQAYKEFKEKTGIDLSGALLDEIKKQGW
jgi:hypothetical protein